jgi:hypothetical protein
MNKFLFATGVALALMAAPALAQPVGYVGGSYVNSTIDTGLGNNCRARCRSCC